MILAAGIAFLAAGYFIGISRSQRPQPNWDVELVKIPYGGHFWFKGEEYVAESTANTHAICRNISTEDTIQISTYSTVKVWTPLYKKINKFRSSKS